MNESRETLSSRLGFILVSAGCAVGLGNVWRFPYITGKYGGALFLLVYLFFLLAMSLPVLVMEFSIGRASQRSLREGLRRLEPAGTGWHRLGHVALLGWYLLMMFYIPVAGWLLHYTVRAGLDGLRDAPGADAGQRFAGLLQDPLTMAVYALIICAAGFAVCAAGVRKGTERVSKFLMSGLFLLMVGMAGYAVSLPGGMEGVKFFLMPDLARAGSAGWGALVNDALNQAFFTLSIGQGNMAIWGSYLKKDHTLVKESVFVAGLDTLVALTAGMIIFPACFACHVSPDAGPGMIFVTLPHVFNSMPALPGRIFAALFFVFLTAAALTTVIAVVEAIIAHCIDSYGWSRKKSVGVNFAAMCLLVMPCILGFNLWSGFTVPRIGNILEFEDFLVSNNLLPLGALVFCLFCTSRYGWGWDNFLAEANTGAGMGLPRRLRFYLSYILPAGLLLVFLIGYVQKFS